MTDKSTYLPVNHGACRNCSVSLKLTTWRADSGLDPDMRQYKCPLCGAEVYVIRKGSRSLVLEAYVESADEK